MKFIPYTGTICVIRQLLVVYTVKVVQLGTQDSRSFAISLPKLYKSETNLMCVQEGHQKPICTESRAVEGEKKSKTVRALLIDAESVVDVHCQIENALRDSRYLKESKGPSSKLNVSLMITSAALNCVVDGGLDDLFGKLALACKHVVARKLSRTQKAKILDMIRKIEKTKITVTSKARLPIPKKQPQRRSLSRNTSVPDILHRRPSKLACIPEHSTRKMLRANSVVVPKCGSAAESVHPKSILAQKCAEIDEALRCSGSLDIRVSKEPTIVRSVSMIGTEIITPIHRLSGSIEFFLSGLSKTSPSKRKRSSVMVCPERVRGASKFNVGLMKRIQAIGVPCVGLVDQRAQVIREILQTELVYVQKLHELERIFLEPLSRSLVTSKKNRQNVVGVISLVRRVHDMFLKSLLNAAENSKDVAEVFCEFAHYFRVYSLYAHTYEMISGKVLDVLNYVSKGVSGSIKQKGGNKLLSLMIQPIQRLPRYLLLLKELTKHTPNGHAHDWSVSLATKLLADQCWSLNAATPKDLTADKRSTDNVVDSRELSTKARKAAGKRLKAATKTGEIFYSDRVQCSRLANNDCFREMNVYLLKNEIIWTADHRNVVDNVSLSVVNINENGIAWGNEGCSIELNDENKKFSLIMDFSSPSDLRVFRKCLQRLAKARNRAELISN